MRKVRPASGSLCLACITGLLTLSFSFSLPACAEAQWSVTLQTENEGIRRFDFSIGDHFRVPETEVIVIMERIVNEEELPVVFFLARRARVHPKSILDLRCRGYTWIEITREYGLTPEIYYVPLKRQSAKGSPYENIYGQYRTKKEWKGITLTDREIVDQVNLKYFAHNYRVPPKKVARLRSEGKTFAEIYEDCERSRVGRGRQAPHNSRQNAHSRPHDGAKKSGKGG